MDGDIRLGITEGGDAFRPLGEEEDAPTLEGELCYRDDAPAPSAAAGTGATASARRSLTIRRRPSSSSSRWIPAHADDLAAATDQLAAMVERHLGATIFAKQIITRDNPTMVIDE